MAEPKRRAAPRLLQVIRSERIGAHMQRITLGGEQLSGFPHQRNGAHIKVFLPARPTIPPVLPRVNGDGDIVWPADQPRPVTRTYSVRSYRPAQNELDIDFVLHGLAHGGSGPACRWAMQAARGDFLGVAGPGGPQPLLASADWHMLAGDLTALPAISALLEDLPPQACGHAFIDIRNSADRQALRNNTRIQLHWIDGVNDDNALLHAVQRTLPPVDVTLSAFIAGENRAVISIRDYLRATYSLTKARLYAVPYWRRGQNEEAYHAERHRVMDEIY